MNHSSVFKDYNNENHIKNKLFPKMYIYKWLQPLNYFSKEIKSQVSLPIGRFAGTD